MAASGTWFFIAEKVLDTDPVHLPLQHWSKRAAAAGQFLGPRQARFPAESALPAG